MAADILALLLRLNIGAGLAILCVIMLRAPARRLFGPGLSYALWLAVPLTSLAALAPARPEGPVAPPSLPLDAVAQIALDWAVAPPLVVAAAPTIDVALLLLVLWLGGGVLGLAVVVVLHCRSLATLGRLQPTGDTGLLRSESVWSGPAVIGVVRPRIVVPADFEDRFTAVEQAVILTHERIHLARADSAINAVVMMFQCLNWMNPLVHLGARLLRQDQEMACDAAVIERHPDAKRSYAQAMLKTQLAPLQTPLGCYWPARGQNPLKERFAMLKMKSPSRRRRYFGAATISLIVASAGYAAWASNDEVQVATKDVVKAAVIPMPVRISQPLLAQAEKQAPAIPVTTPVMTAGSAAINPASPRPLTQAEITAVQEARAAFAQIKAQEQLGLATKADVAARASELTKLEMSLGVTPTASAEALHLLQDRITELQAQYDVGLARRSDIGLATENLVQLQLMLGQRPSAQSLTFAVNAARQDLDQVLVEIKVGLRPKSDVAEFIERVRRLEALADPRS